MPVRAGEGKGSSARAAGLVTSVKLIERNHDHQICTGRIKAESAMAKRTMGSRERIREQ
jgi:hypothetical protein